MKTKYCLGLGSLVILILLLSISQISVAGGLRTIALAEALELALEQNRGHSLFLWEQDLLEHKEKVKKQPQVTVQAEPVSIDQDSIHGPQGSLTIAMPLGEHLDLSGRVTLGIDEQGLAFTPSGNLNLDYSFFRLPDAKGGSMSLEAERKTQVNNLILQTTASLIELRQAFDQRDYEAERLAYLERMLEAARLTPDYDDLELRKEIRGQQANLVAAEESVGLLQLQLANLLGTSEEEVFEPVFAIHDLQIGLDEEVLREELFASSQALREARNALTLAQEKLDLERKTRGWDVKANGVLALNSAQKAGATWSLGLSATKTLYPRDIILEELELQVAQAEHALELTETSLLHELRGAIQGVKSAQERRVLTGEHLAEAREDLTLRERKYQAGLVTSLQLEDTSLALQQAELNHRQATMAVAQRILDLWNVCGRDIGRFIFQVIQ